VAEMESKDDAERILAAYGWELAGFYYADAELVFTQVFIDDRVAWLTPSILRALDPDRPPSLSAVRRLLRGFERDQEYIKSLAWSGLSDENAEAMLARAWELGGKDEPREKVDG